MAAKSDPSPYGDGGDGDQERTPELSALQQVALAIDALYASDDEAPAHWQDRTQMRKGLRGKVRRLVKDLGLDGWKKEIPLAVEHYAVLHYSKP